MISLCNEWINYDNVYRAKFSALTVPELVQAYDNLARLDNDICYLLGKTNIYSHENSNMIHIAGPTSMQQCVWTHGRSWTSRSGWLSAG